MSRRHLLSLLASALSLALTSCASVSVKRTEILLKNPPQKLPKTILVKPFSITESGLRVDRRGDDLEAFRMALRERMTCLGAAALDLWASLWNPAVAVRGEDLGGIGHRRRVHARVVRFVGGDVLRAAGQKQALQSHEDARAGAAA